MGGIISLGYAQDPITLHQYERKDRLTPDGKSGYNLYFQELLKFTGEDVAYTYGPLKRTTRIFSVDKQSCIYPSNINVWRSVEPGYANIPIIATKPMDFVSIYIYVDEGKSVPLSTEDLNGLRIGYELGSVGATLIEEGLAELVEANTNEQLYKMLKRNRIDAVMGFHPDVPLAFDRLGYEQLKYDSNFALIQIPISILCHDTERNRRFIQRLDHGIIALNYSGKAQELLGKYAEIVPLDVVLTD